MDQFNSYNMNNESSGTDAGQFSDLAGFGNNNNYCQPTSEQVSEPMPALPAMNFNMNSSGNDLFCGFTNEPRNNLPPMPMNNNNIMSQESIATTATVTAPYDKSKAIQPSQTGIKFYSRNDVLCGRGGGTNVHPGNRRFRDLINANRRAYLKARKNDKPAISRSIVRTVREMNGRFLKKDEKLGMWFEIGDDGAREKTSQALRQRAPEMKKILFEDEQRQRRQQQQQLMQRSFMNGGMNNFGYNQMMPNSDMNLQGSDMSNSNMMNNSMSNMNMMNNSLPLPSTNNTSIYEQYAMLQQKNYFQKSQDVFLKKLAMNGFDSNALEEKQRDMERMTSQTLLSQGIKPITPRGA